jgi:hypothetical protein
VLTRAAPVAFSLCIALLPSVPGARAATMPAAGDYLEARFIDTVQRTRSIEAADAVCNHLLVAQLATVTSDAKGFQIGQVENWHEGQNLFEITPDGRMKNGDDNDGDTTIEIPDAHHIKTRSAGGSRAANFVLVGNAAHFIEHSILTGRYMDDAGQPYEFKDDFTGSFPDKQIAFRLDLDDFPADSFTTQDGTVIAFRWSGSELTLYPTFPLPPDAEGYGNPDLDHPIAHLHPVR